MIFSAGYFANRWSDECFARKLAIGTLVFLTVVSLLPVLITPIPAMVDYPNHLARMYLLSQSPGGDANPYYETAWAMYPNLAMDSIIPQLARLLSVEDATRFFLLICQVLVIGGAIALERVVKGHIQLAGFAAVMMLYCLPFTWGFVNFEFGLGLMLWCVAAYLLLIERSWMLRLLVNGLCVASLFAAHFFALGVYGATLGLLELKRAYDRNLSWRSAVFRLAVLAIPAVLLLGLMKIFAGSIGTEGTLWAFEFKLIWPLRIMNGFNLTISAISALALIGFSYFAAKQGVLKMTAEGRLLFAGFLVLYLLIPSRLFGTSFADLRMIPAAALILPAFCSISLRGGRWRVAALAVFIGVTLLNLSVVYWVWLSYRTDYAAVIRSFGKVDRGSFVLSATSGDEEDPPFSDLTRYPMSYAPALAVHYVNAFVPNLYADVGKQPVLVRPAFRHLAMPPGVVPLRLLIEIATHTAPSQTPDAIATWDRDFDYLYILGPHVPNPLPNLLEEIDSSRRFVLYKIRRVGS